MAVRISQERGSVLPLLALLIFAFFAMTSLIVDAGLIAASANKQRYVSDYVALSALRAYDSLPGIAPYTARRDAALAAAREVSGLGENFTVFDYLSHARRTANVPLDLALDETGDKSGIPGDAGKLIPGSWWTSAPTPCSVTGPSQCPCGATPFPCFRPNTGVDTTASAFQVELNTPSPSLFGGLFSSVLHAPPQNVRSLSTASMTPRRIAVLIDMSGSMTATSHPESGMPYAALLKSSVNTCAGPTTYTNPCLGTACQFEFGPNDTKWTALSPAEQAGYLCFQVTYQEAGSSSNTFHYLIDTARAPQPLTDVLTGVHNVLQTLKDRGVPGDRVGAYAFDTEPGVMERIFAPEQPVLGNNTSFDDLWAATNTDSTSASWASDYAARIQQFVLFPREKYDTSGVSLVHTDIARAVERARVSLLSFVDHMQALNSIVVVTDGMANCYQKTTTVTYGSPQCNNDYPSLQLALNELSSYVAPDLRQNQVTLHAILLPVANPSGPALTPHTLLLQSQRDPNRCMDEGEARALDISLVDETLGVIPPGMNLDNRCFPKVAAGRPECATITGYVYQNGIRHAVTTTGGQFLAVRPSCADPGGTGSCAENVRDYLTTSCSQNTTANIPGYTDPNSRLVCDSGCRASSKQIEDSMLAIVGDNPYVVVAEGQ